MTTPYLRLTVKAVLTEARESIVDPANWMKGPSPSRIGPCCAVVAVARVCAREGHGYEVERTAYDTLKECLPWTWVTDDWAQEQHLTESIPQFNDHHSTSHADVIALFDRAVEVG